MNAMAYSRPVFRTMLDIVNLGIAYYRSEDATHALDACKAWQPSMPDLDFYEAWLLMRAHCNAPAFSLLRNLDDNPMTKPTLRAMAQTLMAQIQLRLGDPEWHVMAQRVIDDGACSEAAAMAQMLLNPGSEAQPTDSAMPRPGIDTTSTHMLRA